MRLSDYFIDLIAYVSYFSNLKTKPPFDQVKTDIQRMLSESEKHLESASVSREDFDLARFAICAWVDEAVMSSDWSEKNAWLREPLQRLYYQTSDAGELFFERLNRLGPHQQDVREVYYICLSLGFSGRYCNEGDEFLLEQLKNSNLKLLTGSSMGLPSLDKTELFPEAYPMELESFEPQKVKKTFSPFTFLAIGVPCFLFITLFFIYKFVLSNIGETIISTVP